MFCSPVRIEPLSLGSNPALRCAFWIPRSIAAPLSSRCVTISRSGPSCRHIFRSRHSTANLLSCAQLPATRALGSSVARILSIERISNHSRSRMGAVRTFWTRAEWTCAVDLYRHFFNLAFSISNAESSWFIELIGIGSMPVCRRVTVICH